MQEYFNGGGQTSDMMESIEGAEILKAMEAGLLTGMQYNDTLSTGGGLKAESLDPVIKVLENSLKQLVFWNQMPKLKITNTVHQYLQLFSYGEDVGIFNLEGETPQETDSLYRRKSVIVKFTGVTGQVTNPMMLVHLAGGMDIYAREVENKTIKLLTGIDSALVSGDSSKVATQFDGLWRQHLTGINDIYGGMEGKTTETVLDNYFGDVAVINANGSVLNDALVENASQAVVNDRNGMINGIMANPAVFNDYVKGFHESKRVIVGLENSVTGANMGQSVNSITTQFGKIDVWNDKFFDERKPRKSGSAKTNAQAPNVPTFTVDTAVAVATDAKTQFGSTWAGSYFYAVAAKNRYGESSLGVLNTTAQAVTATQSVNLTFVADNTGSYPAECFVIYRSEKNATSASTANFYPMFEVSVSELASGYDGAAATKVNDRNRFIAGTKSAIVYWNDSQINEYVQLHDTMKIDYAITSPSRRFSVVNYGTPLWCAPGKVARIINIGTPGMVTP